jgi:hypothetical protein
MVKLEASLVLKVAIKLVILLHRSDSSTIWERGISQQPTTVTTYSEPRLAQSLLVARTKVLLHLEKNMLTK